MAEALVITPVKDSLETTSETIKAVSAADGDFIYAVYNDFSKAETRQFLTENQANFRYELINLDEITSKPSPNYMLVLQLAQKKAIELNIPLIIIESDVIIRKDTLTGLLTLAQEKGKAGMVGAITVGRDGRYNFPYEYVKRKSATVVKTKHSLSFCCTLLNIDFLKRFDFGELSAKKDWYDISISRQSKKLGYNNYLAKNYEVVHLPHSSRPWKQLKYSNPLKYYWGKLVNKRDRI